MKNKSCLDDQIIPNNIIRNYLSFTEKGIVMSRTWYSFTTQFPEEQKPSTIEKIIQIPRILDLFEQKYKNKTEKLYS